jgi:hypothetical protein
MKMLLLLYFATTMHAADRWYEIRIADHPSGYQHSTTAVLEGGSIKSTDDTLIVINRLGSKVEIKTVAESIENAAGELVSVKEETSQSQQTLITEAELKGDRILLRSTTGSNSYNRSMTLKAPVCGPARFAHMIGQLTKPGDEASCRLYAPSFGAPYKSTRTLMGAETLDGQKVLRVKTELAGLGSMTELLDPDGFAFEVEREMPFGKMVVRAVDRETALRAAVGAELPAESFDRTMARSNVRFADARAVERVKLKLTHEKPELGWPAFTSPMQRVLEKTPSALILEVAQPERLASREKIDEAPFLRPNQILQSDDPEVVRLAQEIAGKEHDRYRAARKLQDWVAAHMTFDLGIALAPASEVARNRKGTCAAYSVLLASMARAVGIPSRIAGGYIYVYGIWGGHAWVELLIDNQWLPLDAAGYRPGVADAARIQFGSYTAENNLAAFAVAGNQMYGNVDIEVLEYSIGGKTIQVPASARRYTVSEDEYSSAGLGVSIRKPDGFSFAKMDAVYPDQTVLELQNGAAKVTVALAEAIPDTNLVIQKTIAESGSNTIPAKLDGRDAILISSPGNTRLLSADGESLWILKAEGQDASGLLTRFLGGWKWHSPQ